jgi:hypothetical protein
MTKATRIIVLTALKDAAGTIKPSMFAPGKSNASTLNPGRKFIKANIKATFKINIKNPKVRWLIGRRTSEKIGFMIKKIKSNPPITSSMFLGSLPSEIVGIRVYVR